MPALCDLSNETRSILMNASISNVFDCDLRDGKPSPSGSPSGGRSQDKDKEGKRMNQSVVPAADQDCQKIPQQSDSSKHSTMSPKLEECSIPGKASWRIWHNRFEIDKIYKPIKVVGKGAYGIVCSAENIATGEQVAVKKIGNVFESATDAIRCLRELQLLRNLRHFNIVSVKDVLRPHDRAGFKDVYIVYELLDTDLHQIIKSKQTLSNEHLQFFTYQILRALKYMHSAAVLHRDLKPSNLLLTASCDLKIADLGLARTDCEEGGKLTEYVVTRWYRAPELLLSSESYASAIDMWSVGCILAEMIGRHPLFPGRNYQEMLELIIRTLGSPSEEALSHVTSGKATATRAYVRNLQPYDRVDFGQLFPCADPLALDLLDRLLQFDPRERITAEEALSHPWLADLHDEPTEPKAPGRFNFDFDEHSLTEEAIKDLIYKESLLYHPLQK